MQFGGGQNMSFQEADRLYAQLRRQRDAGAIGDGEFDARLQELVVQDGEGRWWAKERETGGWMYHDGNAWISTSGSYGGTTGGASGVPDYGRQTGGGYAEAGSGGRTAEGSGGSRLGLWTGLGIACAVLAALFGFLGIIFGIAGLVFGFLALRIRQSRGLIVLAANAVGILLGIFSNVLLLLL